MRVETLLYYALILNTILAFLLWIFLVICHKKEKGVVYGLFVLFCPGISLILLTFTPLVVCLVKWRKHGAENLDYLQRTQLQAYDINELNTIAGENLVPVEEALVISDKEDKRKVFLNMLKSDDACNVSIMKAAIHHEDSEIAHYAAAAISSQLEKFKRKEQILYAECRQTSSRSEALVSYVDEVSRFLLDELLPLPEQKAYLGRLEEIVKLLGETKDGELSGKYLAALIRLYLKTNKFEKASDYVEQAKKICEHDLDAYKGILFFYYELRDDKNFRKLLEKIKQTKLVLDSESLEWIRFYQV